MFIIITNPNKLQKLEDVPGGQISKLKICFKTTLKGNIV